MDWEIEKSQRVCAACQRAFGEGDEFYGALYDAAEGYRRADYCFGCWPPAEPPFGYWRTRIPRKDEPRHQPIDYERLMEMFERMDDAGSPRQQHVRYILALMLIRKRRLKLEGFARQHGGESAMKVRPAGSETGYEVFEPQLTEDEMLHLQDELLTLLEMGAGGFDAFEESAEPQEPVGKKAIEAASADSATESAPANASPGAEGHDGDIVDGSDSSSTEDTPRETP